MAADTAAAVRTAVEGDVLVITIDRPAARNAVNVAVAQGIAAALDRLDVDDALAIGVLTGAGGGFSAGMDLKGFARGETPVVGDRGFAGIVRRASRKPLIAAVEGFAVAGGLEVALACDLIVAARGARMGLPEVKRSLIAAGGGLLRLAQRMPYHAAMEIGLTGEPMSAERLHELGVVNRLAEPGQALTVALALAAEITPNAPLALAATKHIVEHATEWGLEEGWRRQEPIVARVHGSEDAQEGAVAFAEKRPAVWRGR
ncbi:MAG: enoyl-CoA hydratase [Conexibacter sp.]|nr:enoyl-CoA hydratase [Conexibacter sp.]